MTRRIFLIIGVPLALLIQTHIILAQSPAKTPQAPKVHAKKTKIAISPQVKPTRLEHASDAETRLECAIQNPEYMLDHWIELPISPSAKSKKSQRLSLKEAILLALRYNPNIQNVELDRILQRYQLRLAHNEFELQYALAGTAVLERSNYTGVGNTTARNYLLTPELGYKNKWGSQFALTMENTVTPFGNYNPLLNFSFRQPLLRGMNPRVNQAGLLNAIDAEQFNKLNLKQAVMDQITQVTTAYRDLVESGNNLQSQRQQLQEAKKLYDINEKKIHAGQLEPTGNIQQSYQIESLSLMVEQAENDFRTSAQNLLQTIGLDPDMHLSVPSDVTLDKIIIPDVNQSIQQGLAHNTEYMAAKIALKADERALEVAKDQQAWQLDFTANVQTGTLTNVDSNNRGFLGIYNGNNTTESAGVTLSIPLRDLNRRNQLISAKVRIEKDRLNLVAYRRALITSIKNTTNAIQSQAKRYQLAERQVKLAEESYSLEKKKQQAGIASALDVNNTQNQLLLAQMGLISAKIAYLNQLSALQRMLGTTLDYWQIKLRYC